MSSLFLRYPRIALRESSGFLWCNGNWPDFHARSVPFIKGMQKVGCTTITDAHFFTKTSHQLTIKLIFLRFRNMIIGELVSENHVFSSQLQQFGRATVFVLAFCYLQLSMQANNFVVLEAPPTACPQATWQTPGQREGGKKTPGTGAADAERLRTRKHEF